MSDHTTEVPYYGTRFTLVLDAYARPGSGQRWRPGWDVMYDHGMGVGPISFYITMFGEVIGSNPPDLRERIADLDTKGQKVEQPDGAATQESARSAAP